MKLLDAIRFGAIGIVKGKPEYGPIKYYIGEGGGRDEQSDIEKIAKVGMPFYPQMFIDQIKLQQAIKICKSERFMREQVFKSQPEKLEKKLADIDLVLEVLQTLSSEQTLGL